MTFRHKTALVAISVLALGTGFYAATPMAIRWHVEKNYPGVTVGDVSPRLGYSRLSLHVNRPNLTASLPNVRVSWGGRVEIQGGWAAVTLGDSKPTNPSERKVTASGLTVTVFKGSLKAVLHNAALDDQGTITAETGEATNPDFEATFKGVRKAKDDITLTEASGKYLQPIHTYPTTSWSLQGAALNLKDDLGTVAKVTIKPEGGPEIAVEKAMISKDGRKAMAQSVIAMGQRLEKVVVRYGEPIEVQIGGAVLQHEWLNAVPVVFDKMVVLTITNRKVITANLEGFADASWIPDAKTIDGKGACSAWVASLPVGLREPLEGITFTGDVDFRVGYGDKPSLHVNTSCRAKCDAAKLKALAKPFTYKVYSSKNDLVDRTSGPGSADWVPLEAIPEGLINAAITMEDPGYVAHRGVDIGAYRNSLLDNLKLGRFHRGGSTITMQLAKNLWLRRDKTLGRKAQEFFLAQAIESCYLKDKIIELYLNVVEYGPDLYGIGPASKHYFKVTPGQLKPVEAFWLMSILPRPRKAGIPDEATLDRTRKLMGKLVENGRIPEGYLEDPGQPDDSEWGHQL